MSVEDRVRQVASEHTGLPLDQISLESRLNDDLNFDSLDHVEFAMAIEEEFECLFVDGDVDTAKTLQDYVRIIESAPK